MTDEVKRAVARLDDLQPIGDAINAVVAALHHADGERDRWERQWHQTNDELIKARAEIERLKT